MSILDEISGVKRSRPRRSILDEIASTSNDAAPIPGDSQSVNNIYPSSPIPAAAGLTSMGVNLLSSGSPDKIIGAAEAGTALATQSPAASAGGITGLATLGMTRGDEDAAVAVQDATEKAFTYKPRTDLGLDYLRTVSELLAPVARTIQGVEQKLGDSSFELGGGDDAVDAALGATVQTIPGAMGMLIPGMRESYRSVRPKKKTLEKELAKGKPESVVEFVDPDMDVVQAADRLGIELEPGTISQNKSFVELTQSLKAQKDNPLAVSELTAIEALGAKAKELTESVTPTDRAAFSDEVLSEFETTISDLNARTHQLHENLISDRSVTVDVSNSKEYLTSILEELGGKKESLSGPEKELYKLLSKEFEMGAFVPPSKVSYGAIDRVRRDIGRGYEGIGPYRNTDTNILDNVYAVIAKDQMAKADELGVGDQLRLANELVQQRKGLEKQTLELFGNKLQRTLVPKISTARGQISKGDLTGFRQLMKALPEKYKSDGAALVVDALMGDNRGRFSLGNFAGVIETFNRNPKLKEEVLRHFDASQRQVFNDLAAVTTAIQRTKSRENTSGTAKAIVAAIESEGAISKLFKESRDIARAEGMSSAVGAPGFGIASYLLTKTQRNRVTGSEAATDLLTSARFRTALRKVEQDKIEQANRIVESSPEYKAWSKYNPTSASRVAATGFFGWLASVPSDPEEEAE